MMACACSKAEEEQDLGVCLFDHLPFQKDPLHSYPQAQASIQGPGLWLVEVQSGQQDLDQCMAWALVLWNMLIMVKAQVQLAWGWASVLGGQDAQILKSVGFV
jgi:hypothetical protein